MPTLSDITTGVQSTTATGALTPTTGLNISGMTGDWTIVIEVESLTAGKKAAIQIEDSVNGFTAAIAGPVVNLVGEVQTAANRRYTFRKYDFPSLRFGTGSAVLRANVTRIDSATTLTAHCWVET